MLGPFATASRFTLPFTRCLYCRTPLAHRCPRRRRRRRQRVTEGTAMAPWNGPNKILREFYLHLVSHHSAVISRVTRLTSCYWCCCHDNQSCDDQQMTYYWRHRHRISTRASTEDTFRHEQQLRSCLYRYWRLALPPPCQPVNELSPRLRRRCRKR